MANTEMIQFLWDRDTQGYQWSEPPKGHPEATKGPYLNPLSWKTEEYYPFEELGLFRQFADTKPTKEGIMVFAKGYGQLGPDNHLPTWRNQIKEMDSTLRIWDLVQNRDIVRLRFLIRWEKEAIYLESDDGDVLIASEETGFMERFRRDDPFKPAMFYLQRIINKQLEGQASAKLLWSVDRSRLHLHVMPTTLLGGLWLQFARAIDGNISYRACKTGCGRWIALQPGSARDDKEYCSHACRQKAYRASRVTPKTVVKSEAKLLKKVGETKGKHKTK